MASILTPVSLWEDFQFNEELSYKVLSEKTEDGIVIKEFSLVGRKVEEENVDIYAVLAQPEGSNTSGAIYVISSYNSPINLSLLKDIAKQGYVAFSVDFMGNASGHGEHYTVYPSSISYANADLTTDSLHFIKDSVKHSCWYEWDVVARYGFKYLKEKFDMDKIAGLGVYQGSLLLWHLAALEKLSCSIFISGTGWRAYRGNFKFDDVPEPNFDESVYSYLAGVEPQAYAKYVKCPTLILTQTNSPYCDNDRAYDTIFRIDKSLYTAIDYSVNEVIGIYEDQFKDVNLFLDKHIKGVAVDLPAPMEISSTETEKGIVITVKPCEKELALLTLFYAEDTVDPAYRCWRPLKTEKNENGEYTYLYSPTGNADICFFFAKARYKNGFTVSSNVIAERTEAKSGDDDSKLKVIYASGADPIIFSDGKHEGLFDGGVVVKKNPESKIGPMGISGVYAEDRLTTFAVNSNADKPLPNANLMFDVYSSVHGAMKVKLLFSEGGKDTEYVYSFDVKGYDVWQAVIINPDRFKSEEGKSIANIGNLKRITFEKEGSFAINNLLWI